MQVGVVADDDVLDLVQVLLSVYSLKHNCYRKPLAFSSSDLPIRSAAACAAAAAGGGLGATSLVGLRATHRGSGVCVPDFFTFHRSWRQSTTRRPSRASCAPSMPASEWRWTASSR